MAAPLLKSSFESEVNSISILLAEDNEVTQELLVHLLSRRGHKVDAVSNGNEAYEALKKNNYDIALLDFHLPDLDGLEVVTKTREEYKKSRKSTYFIGITADVAGLLAHPGNCENFNHVFAKPFEPTEICTAIENTDFRKPSGPSVVLPNRVSAAYARPQSEQEKSERGSAGARQRRTYRAERRKDKRTEISVDGATMRMADGSEWKCRITNISLSGMAVEVEANPPLSSVVTIGRNRARVVRHTEVGIAVEFI